MITGVVTASREATIRLLIQEASGQLQPLDALIDTGFSGFLTLPSARIASLGLLWLSRQQGLLADGSIQVFDVYAATVEWDGQLRLVEVEAADTDVLLGMSLLAGYELRIQVLPGGLVTLGAIP
jgi:clan AA aspartic protease